MKQNPDVITFSEKELIESIVGGNSGQFEVLIRRNNTMLYKIGRSYGFNHEDTQDLMQDTFLDAYTGLPKFQGRSAFRTWLVKIMLSNCYAKGRKADHKYEQAADINENSTPIYANTQTETNMIVMNRELATVIENALKKVPVEYRMVFSLREISGMNVSETAEALDISETNVRARLSRAKAMLRKEVEKSYSPEDIFEFNLVWCDRMVQRVMGEIKRRES
jgi:RNA polymerase sigma-70 factor (ECF subfamily)